LNVLWDVDREDMRLEGPETDLVEDLLGERRPIVLGGLRRGDSGMDGMKGFLEEELIDDVVGRYDRAA
jgi:hypothetical protein